MVSSINGRLYEKKLMEVSPVNCNFAKKMSFKTFASDIPQKF
jgi:hypothetical protein